MSPQDSAQNSAEFPVHTSAPLEAARTDGIGGALWYRLAAIEDQVAGFQDRSRHREAIIDRLHAENQELRSGERRAVLDPVVTDLMRLYDALGSQARGLEDRGSGNIATLLHSLADDVVLALERIGVESFPVAVGEPFDPGRHRALAAVPTGDAELGATLAHVDAVGFVDAVSGRVRRKAPVRVYRHNGPPPGGSPPGGSTAGGDTGKTHAQKDGT